MGLKFTLTPDEYNALADDAKPHYKEVDGKWRLDVDGAPDVREFRETNVRLMQESREMATRLGALEAENASLKQRFDGIDPDEARRTIADIKDKSGKPDGKLADVLAAALAPLQTQIKSLSDTVAQREKDATDARAREIRVRKETRLRDLASTHKVKDNPVFRGVIVREGDDMFDYDPDADTLRPKRRTEEGHDITPDRWFQSLRQSAPEMFGDTRGPSPSQDAAASGIVDRGGAKVLVNPTAFQMAEHAEDIAKGALKVVRE